MPARFSQNNTPASKTVGTTQKLVRLFNSEQQFSLFLDNRLFNLNGIWRNLVRPWPDRPDRLLRPWQAKVS